MQHKAHYDSLYTYTSNTYTRIRVFFRIRFVTSIPICLCDTISDFLKKNILTVCYTPAFWPSRSFNQCLVEPARGYFNLKMIVRIANHYQTPSIHFTLIKAEISPICHQ